MASTQQKQKKKQSSLIKGKENGSNKSSGGYDKEKGEAIALKSTGKSVRQTYNTLLKANKEKPKKFDLALLRAMSTGGLDNDEIQLTRIEEYVKKGYLGAREIRPTNDMLKHEITRRWEIENELQDGPKAKKPPLSGKADKLVDRLSNASRDLSSATYPLKYKSEKQWLEKKIDKCWSTS